MNICIFGDSIAWGAYDPKRGGWANCLRNYLEAKNKDINVYNLSISGDTTTDLLNRFEVEVKSREPNIVIFAIGINDAQSVRGANLTRISIDEFNNNLKKLHSTANKFADKIIFIGLTSVDELKMKSIFSSFYANQNIKYFNTEIKKFCEENNARFISMDGVVNIINLEDGLHPNTKGHKKMFDKIRSEMETIIG